MARREHLKNSSGRWRWIDNMGRKILFVTTDQQRFDTLGCNGGTLSRTPVADSLCAEGYRYTRAHPQSVVCMPSRSTMITGQYPSTHGVWMNGVALPTDAHHLSAWLQSRRHRRRAVRPGRGSAPTREPLERSCVRSETQRPRRRPMGPSTNPADPAPSGRSAGVALRFGHGDRCRCIAREVPVRA